MKVRWRAPEVPARKAHTHARVTSICERHTQFRGALLGVVAAMAARSAARHGLHMTTMPTKWLHLPAYVRSLAKGATFASPSSAVRALTTSMKVSV